MLYRTPNSRTAPRKGVAAVELAVLLPFLAFIFVVTVDFSRIFYDALILSNCARNGALYACANPTNSLDTTGIQNAALADASNLSPTPTVTSTTGTNSDGNYVQVTVTWTFQTITNYPGIPSTITLTRTVQMRVSPRVPDFS
jgi:Flp pilus assembly protein TadG